MTKGLKKYRWLKWLDENEISILLVSIIALVALPPFLSSDTAEINQFMNLVFLPILISCFLIIRKRPITRYISIVTFVLVLFNLFFNSILLDVGVQLGISILIIHAFFLVLREAISLNGTRSNMILISITGYMIIGLLGGFMAEGLEHSIPESYYHSTGIDLGLYNFIYYSYVTMTTLGYGDIIPVTKKSQSLALILVLAGQLYLAVIIAINISKFMQKKSS
jgi:voltage-gated potassium channel Kch